MKTLIAETLREKLLRAPPSARRNYTVRGRPVYSRKLGRRFYVYLDAGYAMWLELEFDPSVVAFNMEPPPMTFGQDKDSDGIAMAAVSIDEANRLTLHFTQAAIDKSAKGASLFEQMKASQEIKVLGASIRIWTDLDDLDRLDRANKHTLLRYLCAPQVVVNAGIEKEILDKFKMVRTICLWDLLHIFTGRADEEEVKTALANLIVSKQVFLDMTKRFALLSNISRHEIS